MNVEQARFNMREQARFNMIEQQIRTWEVLDPTVLNLLNNVPREDFVPEQYQGLVFADLEIPLGYGQAMLSPKMEARMLQALDIKKTDSVLEIGTGSGYMTALLAKLSKEVFSVELIPELSAAAAHKLVAHGISNIILEVGDGAHGWKNEVFDVIVLTGSLPVFPKAFEQQLKVGGRLLVVVGEAPAMEAVLVHCVSAGVTRRVSLFETSIPSLMNATQPERFSF
ncbi:MAG: protein-L-isoaspartate O-methyltransferase family protein [Methylophilaceae bacterium]